MSETIKIHVLHCGQVQTDMALPFNQNTLNPIAFTGIFRSKKYQNKLPVSAYLIEHPKGLVLIDTGWHTDVRKDQRKYMGRIHYQINKAILPEGQAIDEQLQNLGVKIKNLDYVILSHLDIDHASGIKLVSKAKNILTSDIEWEAAPKSKHRYLQHMWEGVPIRTFSFKPSEYGPQHQSFDLFGDESLIFVHTPGHSHGLSATIVKNNGKFVLLTSDTGYAKKSWEEMILQGVLVNKQQAIESLKWVKHMSNEPNCIEVIANHDPDIKPHTIVL
ncbi:MULTISPECIES: N-acyl homoserine lactonase family protein [Paenibacillus]|nr:MULTISPECIES: N-acyl homoserine lactonase family protein [Paenibacillus]ALA44860.1 beta-lactamase [Paenibacillus peoriae]KJD43923.1 beta-lactamase [Paenibacillus terrae]MDR6776348.1 glyoxylase-like metal-dependent hydrolase (beta-lactamase superfamily II) [Paenibacillus peoriae]ODA05726.1 MBL fold metallo-hydrolase [Paenibacillus polymyxa]OME72997.1 MBL fold metallo-hydrolase [Paenibacillus peoriae]